ncbi:MAG: phosphate ABC transporter substrate-binding protein PstS [Acidobacteria bacterium]|nr:MAG: phosphate ABC transporter substrate-binding protein PstS [Acidobacteriota bacterium]
MCNRGSPKARPRRKTLKKLYPVLAFVLLALPSLAQTKLNAAGATFPYPIYSKWFNEYHQQHPDIEINYQSIGSGGGIAQVTAGTVDFGASDGPMKDEQIAAFKQQRGTSVLHFPTVLGAVVPAYNIPGFKSELKFTPEVLAGIYLGKITSWNDPAIAKANPGTSLPNASIVVVHRSDGSGTTYIWTDYLSKVSSDWNNQVGKGTSVKWPVGMGAKGNEGVAGMIRQMDGAFGYVELIYALQNKITFGSVQNAAGNFVKASLDSTTAAASSVKTMPADFRVSITNAPGKDAYPIASFTWLLVPADWKDKSKQKIVVDFLNWMLDQGQTMSAQLDYAPLPDSVKEKERAAVKAIH